MRRKNFFGMLLLALLAFCFIACSDDDPTPFTFYDDYYEVPIHGTRYISLKTGHRNYEVQIDDPRYAHVTIEDGWSDPNGMIVLSGVLTGETTLIITDNERNQKHVLKVRIVPNYESFYSNTIRENQHPALYDVTTFLMNTPQREVFFLKREPISSTDFKMVLVTQGTYAFSKEGDDLFLTLTYASNDGKFTDAAIAPEPHKFLITKISDHLLHKFNMNLNLGFDTTPAVETSYSSYDWSDAFEMEEMGTTYKVSASVPITSQLPEGILKY